MAEDWAANVKKYVPDADDGIIAGIVRYCGIALQKRDSSLVSFGDPTETKRVRENFLKKKLALTDSDAKLDAAIAAVGERMKDESFRNRVTVYYLLAEKFGKLQLFAKATKAPAASKGKAAAPKPAKPAAGVASAAGVVGAAAIGAAGAVASGAMSGAKAVGETAADAVGAVASGAKAVGDTAVGAAGAAGAAAIGAAGAAAAMMGSAASAAGSGVSGAAQALKGDDSDEGGSGWGWLIWLLLAALVLGVLWWLFRGKPATSADSGVTTEQSAAATGTEADAVATGDAGATPPPAEGTVAIPTGAGVTTETRDGKPVVKVYFNSGKADVVPAFTPAAAALKSYLDSHAGSSLAVSGFNDPTGNAAFNADLSKRRAEAVKAALVTSGIADPSITLVPPAAATDTTTNLAGARRVEVVVK